MDAGKAVSMTTAQETTGWATSLPLWWRSSANAQVCVHSNVCVCECVGVTMKIVTQLAVVKCQPGVLGILLHIFGFNTEEELGERQKKKMMTKT